MIDLLLSTVYNLLQVKQVYIDYARNAKRLDIKKLKTKMWETITENVEDMKENMVCDFPYYVYTVS